MRVSITTCLRKYADFSGRACRSEFWWFYLFTALVGIVMAIPYYVFAEAASLASDTGVASALAVVSVVWFVCWMAVSIALFIPFLAAGARRLHDSGKSAWLLLLLLVPCASLALIVLWILEGTRGENMYGPVT